jgi:hypothetical protein
VSEAVDRFDAKPVPVTDKQAGKQNPASLKNQTESKP